MNNEEKILEMLVAMQGDISSMQGDISSIKGRLDRMDERINNIDDRSLRTAMLVENELVPKVQLLYEGHETILERLEEMAPKSRVEALEEEVALLKDAFKMMRQELAALKQAQ